MIDQLKQLSLFSLLNEEELKELVPYANQVSFLKGETIIRQGQIGEQLYVIQSGVVHIELESPNRVHISTLTSGTFFGEMSCLTGDPISANVVAAEDVSTFTLNRDGMLRLMERSTQFRNHLIEAMVKRIQKSNERVAVEYSKSLYFMRRNELEDREKYGEFVGSSKQIKSVREKMSEAVGDLRLIVIDGESGVGKTHAAKRIHYMSSRNMEPVLTISSVELDWNEWNSITAAVGCGTLIMTQGEELTEEQLRFIQSKSRNQHGVIITSLKKIALRDARNIHIPPLRERLADIPLLAAHYLSKEHIQQAAISEEALRTLQLYPYLSGNITELIQVLEAAYLLSEGRTIQSSHLKFSHSRPAGVRPKIGLALGSGALRGISHIGVLHALEDEGIPIDYIAGTSAGAVVGGAYAAGMSPTELEEAVLRMKWNNVVKFTFPKRSIFHNEPLADFIESHLGDVAIEELQTPFAAVASDATTGEAHIMREGSLARAIAASTAIPAVMRSQQYQGKTLVDGAVVHPVPAALARSMGADIVIAVNVCTENYTKGVPSNFVVSLLNTIDIMSAKIVREELQLANIVIRPDLDHISVGFKEPDQYIAQGEAAAREHIHTIKQLAELE